MSDSPAMISATRICPKCGAEIPADAPEGGCPSCLLRAGLGTISNEEGDTLVVTEGRHATRNEHVAKLAGDFGDYEIARREDGSLWELGRGGMGVTYRARDTVLHRSVALKVIEVPPGAGNSPAVRERFLREARATAALRHPNVAAVYHFGTVSEPDRCYYAMELVEGETLDARVRREGPLKVAQVLEIGVQVTRALTDAAHQGLIHRDLKPGNIMLTRDEDSSAGFGVKVIDFGLAKVTAESFGETDLTHGGFVGTPSYASPEQFAGGRVDARSDIYSLGASLWFALTGRLPCAGNKAEEIRRCQMEALLPVQQLVARKVPAPVIELLRTMLAVDPDERPASARELMEAIEECRLKLTGGNETTRRNFFAELQRRNVYKVAIAYAVIAWLLMQITTQVFPFLEIPNWAIRLVIMLLVLGFPIALVIAWAFELTPEGSKRTEVADHEPAKPSRNQAWIYVVVIAAALSVCLFSIGRYNAPNKHPTIRLPEKSVAVLPFENLSADPENAFFTDGVQDEILNNLAKIADLKVISRTSVMQYKSGAKRNLRQIANELGVAHVVEGSVQRAANRVRVSAQLIDAKTDTHLWAERYDRSLDDVFAIQSDIAQAIVGALRVTLSPSQATALAAAPTRDTEAYDLFLKGEYQERQAESAEDKELFDRAETFYRQALARDPNFALAYARLAYNRLFRHWFGNRLDSAQLEEVKSNIDRALAIDPNSPEAYLALGMFYYWGQRDFDSALRELDRAIELQPSNSDSRTFRGAIYRRRGEWRRSLTEYEQALELNPRDSSIPTEIGNSYLCLRRWNDAERAFTRALALDPHNINAGYHLAQSYTNSAGDIRRARQAWEGIPEQLTNSAGREIVISEMIGESVYLDVLEKHFADALKAWDNVPTNTPQAHLRQLGARVGIQLLAGQNAAAKPECEEARVLLEAQVAKRQPDDHTSGSELAWIYVYLGRNVDALRIAREAAESSPIEKDTLVGTDFLVGLAQIEARAGQSQGAVKLLRQLLTIPAGEFISVTRLKIDPVWDPIRNDPGFQKLLSEPDPATIYK